MVPFVVADGLAASVFLFFFELLVAAAAAFEGAGIASCVGAALAALALLLLLFEEAFLLLLGAVTVGELAASSVVSTLGMLPFCMSDACTAADMSATAYVASIDLRPLMLLLLPMLLRQLLPAAPPAGCAGSAEAPSVRLKLCVGKLPGRGSAGDSWLASWEAAPSAKAACSSAYSSAMQHSMCIVSMLQVPGRGV
jgi:hypothetical protein